MACPRSYCGGFPGQWMWSGTTLSTSPTTIVLWLLADSVTRWKCTPIGLTRYIIFVFLFINAVCVVVCASILLWRALLRSGEWRQTHFICHCCKVWSSEWDWNVWNSSLKGMVHIGKVSGRWHPSLVGSGKFCVTCFSLDFRTNRSCV